MRRGGGYQPLSSNDVRANTSSIAEIWDSENHIFVESNVKSLMNNIGGDTSITTLESLAKKTNSRGEIYRGKSLGSSSSLAGSSTSVTFGGLVWKTVYLSMDKNDNVVLTLWLESDTQSAWSGRSSTEGGDIFGFSSGRLTSSFGYYNAPYGNNMYGVSYINVLTLNNGGYYATSYSPSSTTVSSFVEKDSSSAFAVFTMAEYGLTHYLVTPRDIPWQESQEFVDFVSNTSTETYYNLPNDAWSLDMSNENFESASENYANYQYSDAWADSYLWLPSLLEVGCSRYYYAKESSSNSETLDSKSGFSGLWGCRGKSSSDKYYIRTGGTTGLNPPMSISDGALSQSFGNTNTNSGSTERKYGICPAIHLNLTKITENFSVDYGPVGEIWNQDSMDFNSTNLNILMKYISGDSNATISTLDILAQKSSSYGTIYNGYSAGDMRTNTISAGTTGGVSYGAKTSGQDIVVTLGGLKWQVEYLSKDKSGNIILTLWLDNCVQDKWKDTTKYTSTTGKHYGFVRGGLYGTWSNIFSSGSPTVKYPSNMYGISYIHAVTLNNGGTYATSTRSITTATQSTSNPFALFTMSDYGLTDYLVTPSEVSWQETQSAKTTIGFSNNLPNDAWSSSMTDGFYTNSSGGLMNYAGKTGNDYWADDYLWLPSLTETGRNTSYTGLWETSIEQRKNYDGSTTYLGGFQFSSFFRGVGTYSWLRSGYWLRAHNVYVLDPSGSSFSELDVNYDLQGIRPALHLNLTAVVDSFDTSTFVQVGELYDTSTQTFNSDNLDIMYKYLTGNANATIDNIGFYNAMDVRETTLSAGTHNGVAYKAKKSGQDVVVRLCGLDWYVVSNQDLVITLYLKGGTQEKWLDTSTYTSTAGEYYGFIDGVLYGDFSANFQSTSTSNTPSNMYGGSYVNAEILGNGGTYATSGTTSATASSPDIDDPFYYFHNINYTLNTCLVSPRQMGCYNSTSLTEWFPNDLLGSGGVDYSSTFDYSSKSDYGAWGDSNLWLPGLYDLEQETRWMLSTEQRANGELTDSFAVIGTVGTKGENAYASTWLRSGHTKRAYMAYTMLADGMGYGTSGVGGAHVIRPALNLDLTKAELYRY